MVLKQITKKTPEKPRKKTRFSKFEMVIAFEDEDQINFLDLDTNTTL